jgi:predicted permease
MGAEVPAERKERYLRQHLALRPGGQGVDWLRRESRQPMVLLMVAVGVVLLIACANIANLLLARAVSRQREAAVRRALGAGRRRLLVQFLLESLLLALAGGALGLLVGWWGLSVLARLLPPELARVVPPGLDMRALGFTFAVSALAALLFGVAPSLQLARAEVFTALKTGGLTTAGRSSPMRRGLVAVQVGLAVLLLTTAGLFLRTLLNLRSVRPGFRPDQLLVFTVDPSRSGYPPGKSAALRQALLDRVRVLPGVAAAAIASDAVLSGSSRGSVIWNVEGYTSNIEGVMSSVDAIGPGYLSAIGVPLLAGRECTAQDTRNAPPVALVNQAFARRFFGVANPVGKRFGFGEKGSPLSHEIVGLVPDAAFRSLREVHGLMIYTCFEQVGSELFTMHVRTAMDPEALFPALRATIRGLDPELPLLDLKTVRLRMAETLASERALAVLTSAFAWLALVLAGTGLYGVISYSVARRRREIGIRMAVGAPRPAILGLVLRETSGMAMAGVLGGVVASWLVSGFTRSLLFGVEPQDPMILLSSAGISLVLAVVASWAPARRALAVDPVEALREE